MFDVRQLETLRDNDLVVRSALEVHEAQTSRVEADADGVRLWFESAARLSRSPEALASAFFFPSLKLDRRLAVEGDLCLDFVMNLGEVRRIAKLWWGFDGGRFAPATRGSVKPMVAGRYPVRTGPEHTGMFFTGGVDSFFTLRRRIGAVRTLVSVEGFDIPLADEPRLAATRALLTRAADDLGLDLVTVRTNMREHPTFAAVDWGISHIAALASVGHSLAHRLSTLFVASSDVPPPWGSHPYLDALWSSSRLTLVNDGAETSRLDKVRAIADWPVVHRTLKVCWENRAASLNCGLCEKCVRTQVQFAAAGCENAVKTFPEGDLADRVDALPFTTGELLKQWRDLRPHLGSPRLQAAAAALIMRSEQRRAA